MNKLHEHRRKAALATHGVDRNNATPKRASIKATPSGAGADLRPRSRNKIIK